MYLINPGHGNMHAPAPTHSAHAQYHGMLHLSPNWPHITKVILSASCCPAVGFPHIGLSLIVDSKDQSAVSVLSASLKLALLSHYFGLLVWPVAEMCTGPQVCEMQCSSN